VRSLEYGFREGWASIWRARGSSASAIVAIALAMVVLGALLLVTWNLDRLLAQWTSAAELSIFLRDDATSEQRGAIEGVVDGSGVAEAREYVSKTDALARFRREFADVASLADDLDDNPFPASVEVRLLASADNLRMTALVERLGGLPGVSDVRYDREWLRRVGSGLTAMRRTGFAFGLLMALAAGVTVASVVRLGLQARREEIEIMQLVGSPISFIRGPFVAEGILLGGIGALLALTALWMAYLLAGSWWGAELTAFLDGESIRFLPIPLCLTLAVGGMAVGGLGGLAAARHAV
jgi:cell division transport system permease protein